MQTFSRTTAFVVVAALSVGLIGCGDEATSPTIAGEWKQWDSVTELADDAELIVVGTVEKPAGRFEIIEASRDDASLVVTKADEVSLFRVEQVLKGDPKLRDKEIAVGIADFGALSDNVTPIRESERLLLFLASFTFGDRDGRDDGSLQGWVPLSSDTGVFDVSGDHATARGTTGPIARADVNIGDLAGDVIDHR